MDIFYFIIFAAVGIFNILAAVLDWKWYIDYWARQSGRRQNGNPGMRNFLRFILGIFGAVLVAFGTGVLVGWL